MKEKERDKRDKLKLQKNFGLHLVKLRESKGLTPAELGRLCYMERSSIARLETGRINPSLFILKKLSVGLGIELEELFKGFK
ncbi:MAG: helix-turn-helix domain-containing protein [Sphingobacteriaceae bacterium]|jgi:putative transcriptional regulator